MPKSTVEDFDSVLLEAIDTAASAVLGEATKSALYTHLEKVLGLLKCEIPDRIDDFSSCIEDLLGLGARFLEIMIIKNLHSKACVVWEWKSPNPWVLPDFTFKDYVSHVKKYFEEANSFDEQTCVFIDEAQAIEKYR